MPPLPGNYKIKVILSDIISSFIYTTNRYLLGGDTTMLPLSHYKIIEENNGLTVVLYLDKNSPELSTEFRYALKQNWKNINGYVQSIIKESYPNVKIKTVKVMAGSFLLLTIPFNQVEAGTLEYNMSYLYFGNKAKHTQMVDHTGAALNVISPSYFDINPDGTLKITTLLDQTFINDMHHRGKKVVPFISNHWDRELGRLALQNREQYTTQIAEAVEKYNLDGVNVDIENVTDVDRDSFTDFVKLLREKLPAHKEVSVAVAANPYGWDKGWHGSYDYEKLALYSDHLFIMAYDQSYYSGPEGPVASLPWVEKSIQYALNQNVPPEKIVLGIPFFGRYWQEGSTVGGYGIPNNRMDELINNYDTALIYDPLYQSPKMKVTINEGDPPFQIGARVWGPGTYHIWYENEDSMKAKVDLAHKYNIKGTGSWSLGQEDIDIWDDYENWILGTENQQAQIQQPIDEQTNDLNTYIVKAGDTLWGISKQFGISVEEIKRINNLASDTIFVGQTLKLSATNVTSEPKIDSTNQTITKAPNGQIGLVTIKKPINLWKRTEDGKLIYSRILKPREVYRVYNMDDRYGGQYSVGGGYWITNMKDYISFQPHTTTTTTPTTQESVAVQRGTSGEIGYLHIDKPINLWKRDEQGKLHFSRILYPGQTYKVYNTDDKHGGQFSVGGGYWVTNIPTQVRFEKFSK
jgi:spore germination protein YaaH